MNLYEVVISYRKKDNFDPYGNLKFYLEDDGETYFHNAGIGDISYRFFKGIKINENDSRYELVLGSKANVAGTHVLSFRLFANANSLEEKMPETAITFEFNSESEIVGTTEGRFFFKISDFFREENSATVESIRKLELDEREEQRLLNKLKTGYAMNEKLSANLQAEFQSFQDLKKVMIGFGDKEKTKKMQNEDRAK